MDNHGLTVRLAEGSEPGTTRVTFSHGAIWIATFHTCGETVGIAVMRRGSEAEEPVLRPRVAAIVRADQAFKQTLHRLANGQAAP
ncbi:MAG TPA: hypothetical protein PLS53_01315 [Thermoanaerobaculaceae bacterium]|nr:hypothetical protein [Thermoanaerobaculaceae bacterium]HPS76775.1 hypothetical protein [Thermoanaerobaculaceae bacterium]